VNRPRPGRPRLFIAAEFVQRAADGLAGGTAGGSGA